MKLADRKKEEDASSRVQSHVTLEDGDVAAFIISLMASFLASKVSEASSLMELIKVRWLLPEDYVKE